MVQGKRRFRDPGEREEISSARRDLAGASPTTREAGQGQRGHEILTLQRKVGNRAVTGLLAASFAAATQSRSDRGGSDGPAVQRRIDLGPGKVAALRSEQGLKKGARTKDTLFKLERAMGAYAAADGLADELMALRVIVKYCERYIDRHKGMPADRAKVVAVEEFYAPARREVGVIRANFKYLEDFAQTDDNAGAPADQMAFPNLANTSAMNQAKQTMAGKKQMGMASADVPRAKQLADTIGVTLAELTGLITFGGDDFEYMNPVISGDDKWLANNRPATAATKTPGGKDLTPAALGEKQRLKEQGALHGAFAIAAVRKVPSNNGRVYRGAKAFGAKPKAGDILNPKTIESWSPKEGTAQTFAGPPGGWMFQMDTTRARDISLLKGLMAGEPEWALLPGERYRVTRVEDKAGYAWFYCDEA